VRRIVRIALWSAVFLGAAGVGAYIAAHTELFPPGVESAVTSGSPAPVTGTPAPDDPTWSGRIRSSSSHDLYVGGRCTTDWVTTLTFEALDNGRIVGTGTSRLHGNRVCTFPNAQVNAEEIEVSVGGTWDQRGFHLSLRDGDRSPRGTADYGGFAPTVFDSEHDAVLNVHLDREDSASATVRLGRVDEQGRGRYSCTNRISLALAA